MEGDAVQCDRAGLYRRGRVRPSDLEGFCRRSVTVLGDAAPSIDENATVRGPITSRPLPDGWSLERARQGVVGAQVLAAVVSFLSTLILGLILLRVYPVFHDESRQYCGISRESLWGWAVWCWW